MHTSSLYHWHPLAHSIDFVRHHQKMSEAMLILLAIGLVYGIATHLASLPMPEFEREFDASGSVVPLTLLTNPADAHEYAQREEFLMTSLNRLLEGKQFERAYVAVYDYADSPALGSIESQIFKIFEATQVGIESKFEHFQGISRTNWLHIQQENRLMGTLTYGDFRSYGFELKDERGVAVGYIGMDRMEDAAPFQDWEIAQLRDTASSIERGLLAPIHSL